MSIDKSPPPKTVLEFKSVSFTVPVIMLADNDLQSIKLQLHEKVSQAPDFFKNSPLIIDFHKLTAQGLSLSVEEVVHILRDQGFMPIGIRGGNQQQNAESLAMNLPVHSLHGQNPPLAEKKAAEKLPVPEVKNPAPADQGLENKLITHPVRSGQRVYARGDLIVTATVSAGAEIMAEGNIHVYGSLRGRALAGVLGNTESRIFCTDLQAELISIAGIYQLRDDLSGFAAHKPVQISLESQKLIIKDI